MTSAKGWAMPDATKKAVSLVEEFKKFAFKGNVIDMAIGIIIGAAFATVVKSLTDDILMPLIGLAMPADKGYEGWFWQVGDKVVPYGKFFGAVVNFLIIAFVLYIFLVKFLGWIVKTKQEAPPPPTKEQELLTEIRDLLKQRAAEPSPIADRPRE
jgi:large conductance mechanosensitive channel